MTHASTSDMNRLLCLAVGVSIAALAACAAPDEGAPEGAASSLKQDDVELAELGSFEGGAKSGVVLWKSYVVRNTKTNAREIVISGYKAVADREPWVDVYIRPGRSPELTWRRDEPATNSILWDLTWDINWVKAKIENGTWRDAWNSNAAIRATYNCWLGVVVNAMKTTPLRAYNNSAPGICLGATSNAFGDCQRLAVKVTPVDWCSQDAQNEWVKGLFDDTKGATCIGANAIMDANGKSADCTTGCVTSKDGNDHCK